jgi:hypothetical protein
MDEVANGSPTKRQSALAIGIAMALVWPRQEDM